MLLDEVKFHELRVLFLKHNDLPVDFKVSTYLSMCQTNVLCSLVELDYKTWVVLLVVLETFFYFSIVGTFSQVCL